ncbi:SGNH/GDSL hydrolase family protein [Paenibacillus sp. HJGM_3]
MAVTPMRLVGLGDSITAGAHVRNEDTFLYKLGQKYGWSVANAGVNGATSSRALERLSLIVPQKPDICLIAFGMNDHVAVRWNEPRVPLQQFQDNLTTICRTVKHTGGLPVLCTIHPIIEGDASGYYYSRHPEEWYHDPLGAQRWIDRYSMGVRDVAEASGAPLADIARYWSDRLRDGVSLADLLLTEHNCGRKDGVHLTPRGHDLYAACLSELLDSYSV